jgi:hypothetical protein
MPPWPRSELVALDAGGSGGGLPEHRRHRRRRRVGGAGRLLQPPVVCSARLHEALLSEMNVLDFTMVWIELSGAGPALLLPLSP